MNSYFIFKTAPKKGMKPMHGHYKHAIKCLLKALDFLHLQIMRPKCFAKNCSLLLGVNGGGDGMFILINLSL